jgi:hypothetical protein
VHAVHTGTHLTNCFHPCCDVVPLSECSQLTFALLHVVMCHGCQITYSDGSYTNRTIVQSMDEWNAVAGADLLLRKHLRVHSGSLTQEDLANLQIGDQVWGLLYGFEKVYTLEVHSLGNVIFEVDAKAKCRDPVLTQVFGVTDRIKAAVPWVHCLSDEARSENVKCCIPHQITAAWITRISASKTFVVQNPALPLYPKFPAQLDKKDLVCTIWWDRYKLLKVIIEEGWMTALRTSEKREINETAAGPAGPARDAKLNDLLSRWSLGHLQSMVVSALAKRTESKPVSAANASGRSSPDSEMQINLDQLHHIGVFQLRAIVGMAGLWPAHTGDRNKATCIHQVNMHAHTYTCIKLRGMLAEKHRLLLHTHTCASCYYSSPLLCSSAFM